MANQTVTASTDMETVIAGGLLDGENITINNGAVVTCTQTPSKLIGTVTINDGKLFIDGQNISSGNVINFVGEYSQAINVNGQGTFEIDGDWYDLGTTDGSNSQSVSVSTYFGANFVDLIPAIWIETGRRIDFDNASGTTPEVDDWVTKVSDLSVTGRIVQVESTYIVVKFLIGSLADNDAIQVRKLVDNNGPDLQVSWTANVDNASGDIKESGVYQAFGNCRCKGTSYIAYFHHGVGGFVFEHAFQATSLTLGSAAGATGGFVPPSGCNIRIPNVHFSTATTTTYASNQTWHGTGTSASTYYNLGIGYGGTVDWSIANIGSAQFAGSSSYAYDIQYIGATCSIGSQGCGNRVTIHECVVCLEPEQPATAGASAFRIQDLPQGADLTDSLFVAAETAPNSIRIETCDAVVVSGCISTKACAGVWNTSGQYCYQVSMTTNSSWDNNVLVLGDETEADQGFNIASSANLTVTNTRFSMAHDNVHPSNGKALFGVSVLSDNIMIKGIECLDNGLPGGYWLSISDVKNSNFRCVGMIDDKIDYGANASTNIVRFSGTCDNCHVARMWKTGGTVEEFMSVLDTTSRITAVNCSGNYASVIDPSGLECAMRGIHGGSGSPGATNGIEDTYALTYGRQFHDGFRSDTVGYIFANCVDPSTDVNNVTILSGTPKFFKDGDLDMESGDSLEIEMDYFAKGHTGFSGTYTSALGNATWGANEWTNVTVEFQYDVGSGWNGTWLNARTSTNWTGISVDPGDGVKLKFKYTATGSSLSMSLFVVDTTTTIAAQKANFYPIDQLTATFTLTGLQSGSEVRVYRDSDDAALDGVESSSTSYSYEYDYVSDTDVYVVIHHLDYLPVRLEDITLSDEDQSIPIQQVIDRQYDNPT